MILKVISDFNIDGLLKKLENFNIFFANQSLYISDVKCENENDFRKYIEDYYKSQGFLIQFHSKDEYFNSTHDRFYISWQL